MKVTADDIRGCREFSPRHPLTRATVILLRKGLLHYPPHIEGGLSFRNHHHPQLTQQGEWAKRGIVAGTAVEIMRPQSIALGEIGIVESVRDTMLDADGWDQFGYRVFRQIPTSTVTVRIPDRLGQWCFYEFSDLQPME